MKELIKLEEEFKIHHLPYIKRSNELKDILQKESIENKKLEFDGIKDKLYYGDVTTWNGFENTIYLIKPISCNDWSAYNVCDISKIKIEMLKGKLRTIIIRNDVVRVSNFTTHYKPLTAELFKLVKVYLDVEISKSLGLFLIDDEKIAE